MTDEIPESERPSKTAVKKEMQALQQLGEKLVKLSNNELAKITIHDEHLIEALSTARKLTSREALRRQLQYIGKLMRGIDLTEIEAGLAKREEGQREQAQQFHRLELLRDELAETGISAIEKALNVYPHGDRQRLRQLVMQIDKDAQAKKPPAAKRKLFQYLKELQAAKPAD
ncbi:ribosome biogenesis factor YjgA [Zhongshania sp.]|uniref:ribosome biogenesis factor YjgA n=1 Tax=Zhongshania sp. TaxID=1971902 RepID=UPI00356AB635